jgi:hypothetical protein
MYQGENCEKLKNDGVQRRKKDRCLMTKCTIKKSDTKKIKWYALKKYRGMSKEPRGIERKR